MQESAAKLRKFRLSNQGNFLEIKNLEENLFMARKSRKPKSVYERIEEKLQSIKEAEELLARLHSELQKLYDEQDDLEMRQLFDIMKSRGLTITEATKLLAGEQNKENIIRKRNKKVIIEEDNSITEE